MPNPAFVVEGHMEMKFVQNSCGGVPVRRLECNGDQVSISAIATRVSLIAKFLNGYSPIIVVFDRERREQTSDQIAAALFAELEGLGHAKEGFVVGVPDRTIENWVLSDRAMLAEEYKLEVPADVADGCFGKSVMKKLFGRDNTYSETTDGPVMLKRVACSRGKLVSKSFSNFLESLSAAGVSCWWLES